MLVLLTLVFMMFSVFVVMLIFKIFNIIALAMIIFNILTLIIELIVFYKLKKKGIFSRAYIESIKTKKYGQLEIFGLLFLKFGLILLIVFSITSIIIGSYIKICKPFNEFDKFKIEDKKVNIDTKNNYVLSDGTKKYISLIV